MRETLLGSMLQVSLIVGLLALIPREGRGQAGALPKLTVASASQLLGKDAELEIEVVEVKYAQRRKLHFLSASANFRAADNLSVAISATDFAKFEKAGITDLAKHFLHQKIRAQGKVLHDEGQWLLSVSVPSAIVRLDRPGDAPQRSQLLVVNEAGKQLVVQLPLDESLAIDSVTTEHDGKPEIYKGVSIATLLRRAEVRLGAEARGKMLGRYVIIRAHDGYACVFSLAELDPYFSAQPPILAQTLNGQNLPAPKAPLQIAAPADTHRRRWVSQVSKIEVHNALDAAMDTPAGRKP